MAENDKTYRLTKVLNLFSANLNTNCYWRFAMLDEKKFPTIIYTRNHTDTGDAIIKIYDVNNIMELIIEFILPKNTSFHKDVSSISNGLNYYDGIFTFVEKQNPDLKENPADSNWYMHKITRYLLSNEEEKIKKVGSYIIKGCGGSVYDNRLFCSHSNGVNIYDVSDGRLIESFFGQIGQRIATKKLIVLESKTQIILYCTITDRKNVIDKQINGITYCGNVIYPAKPGVMEYREGSEITQLGDNYIAITMHTENKAQYMSLLYKLIEDTDVDEKDQCCVCFHFTEKNKALIPCGHTQFCEKCIGVLKKCPLCEKEISSILPIYK